MDHDRSTGEGVGPQEYTLIKMKLLQTRYAVPSNILTCAVLVDLTSKIRLGAKMNWT
jgi:hypothetical protein